MQIGVRPDVRSFGPNHALALLRCLDVPVWAFVDYDPAGLLIAAGLPRLAGIIAREPARLAGIIAREPARLERDLAQGLSQRYQDQLPMAAAALDASRNEPVGRLWALIHRHGRALPQERYLVDALPS